jgi:hypothetical protein
MQYSICNAVGLNLYCSVYAHYNVRMCMPFGLAADICFNVSGFFSGLWQCV